MATVTSIEEPLRVPEILSHLIPEILPTPG